MVTFQTVSFKVNPYWYTPSSKDITSASLDLTFTVNLKQVSVDVLANKPIVLTYQQKVKPSDFLNRTISTNETAFFPLDLPIKPGVTTLVFVSFAVLIRKPVVLRAVQPLLQVLLRAVYPLNQCYFGLYNH